MPTMSATRPSISAATGILAPGWPTTTSRWRPLTISARQRSPSLRTSSTRPEMATSRHVCAELTGPARRSAAGTAATPRPTAAVARRRGAPYAVPTSPVTSRRVPIAGAFVSFGSRTSIAPLASWTTIRRPVPSRMLAGVVTVAWTETARSRVRRAAAMLMTLGAGLDPPGREPEGRRCRCRSHEA